MTPPEKKFFVWDTYWDTTQIQSFGIDAKPVAAGALAQFWAAAVRPLPPSSNVLDIACGNGAAALAMLRAAWRAGSALSITGIDEASIDPVRTTPEHAEELGAIAFKPRVAMETLPFGDGVFDAVASQFGFEFGNPAAGLAEAARVLRPGGMVAILALPGSSEAVTIAKKTLKQARYLLAESHLFESAVNMIRGYYEAPGETAEAKMQVDLEQFCREVEKAFHRFDASEVGILSAIVSCLYKVFADRKVAPAEAQVAAIETARTGLAHYAARAQATIKAAITDGNLGPFRPALAAAGLTLTDTRAVLAQGHGILAYQILAVRNAAQPAPTA